MKTTRILVATLTVLCWYGASSAQRHFTDLPRIGSEFEHRIRNETPEWNCRPIQPTSIDESVANDGVVIRQWTSGQRIVRVAVVQHQSEAQSRIALRQFAADKKTNDRIPGLGAEAYTFGNGKIAFRLANLTVYVTAVVIEDSEAATAHHMVEDGQEVARSDRGEREVITRGFAARIAVILQTL